MPGRPLRSMLYAPGNQPNLVAKVGRFGSDAIILDLEDAVPLAEKAATRPAVRAALPTLAGGPLRYVRVNAMDSNLTRDDLKAVVCADLDGLKLPKVETAEQLVEAESMLDEIEGRAGLPRGQIDLIPLVETAKGGPLGGSTVVTPMGEEVIRRYRTIETIAGAAARAEIASLLKLLRA